MPSSPSIGLIWDLVGSGREKSSSPTRSRAASHCLVICGCTRCIVIALTVLPMNESFPVMAAFMPLTSPPKTPSMTSAFIFTVTSGLPA